jgi:hypothetical protein
VLLELGDQVLADGEEEKAVAKGERVRRSTGYSDSHPHDLSKICVL